MNMDELTLGEIKRIKAILDNITCHEITVDHGIRIVVLDKGFVYVGHTRTDKDWCHIGNAKNLRYWGTTKGLGELCTGPTSKTKYDIAGNISAPMTSVILIMKVEDGKWVD